MAIINETHANLTVVTEALRILDHECPGASGTVHQLLNEARDALVEARLKLGGGALPETLVRPQQDAIAYEEWLEARAYEHRQEGRQ